MQRYMADTTAYLEGQKTLVDLCAFDARTTVGVSRVFASFAAGQVNLNGAHDHTTRAIY